MPKEAPAFLKATDPVCGLVKGEGIKETWMRKETRYWNFKWWLMEKEDDPVRESMTRSLNKARKTYQEFFAQNVQDVDLLLRLTWVIGQAGIWQVTHHDVYIIITIIMKFTSSNIMMTSNIYGVMNPCMPIAWLYQ